MAISMLLTIDGGGEAVVDFMFDKFDGAMLEEYAAHLALLTRGGYADLIRGLLEESLEGQQILGKWDELEGVESEVVIPPSDFVKHHYEKMRDGTDYAN